MKCKNIFVVGAVLAVVLSAWSLAEAARPRVVVGVGVPVPVPHYHYYHPHYYAPHYPWGYVAPARVYRVPVYVPVPVYVQPAPVYPQVQPNYSSPVPSAPIPQPQTDAPALAPVPSPPAQPMNREF
jgi:hypothetical protein